MLVIHSYDSAHGWTKFLKNGINETLGLNPDTAVFHEYLDAKRFPSFSYKATFNQYIYDKYHSIGLDIIMVSDDIALSLVKKTHSSFYNTHPIVYMGINKVEQTLLDEPNYTGVFENRDLANTIFDIKKITQADTLIVISDLTKAGRINLVKVLAAKGNPSSPTNIIVIEQLSNKNVIETISRYGSQAPILKIGQLRDPLNNNALLSWEEGTKILTQRLPNPIFTISSTAVNYGAVGADYLDGTQHGKQAAKLAQKILNGTPVNKVKPIVAAELIWRFNWQLIKKYHFDSANLPPGSHFINLDENFYEKYKILVWVIICAFIISILIIILLIEIIRRGRNTHNILAENETRYKDLAHAGANIFWETDNQHKIIYASGDTHSILGQDISTFHGHKLTDVMRNNPNIEFPWGLLRNKIEKNLPLERIVFKIKKPNQTLKIFVLNGNPIFDKKNKFQGYRGICNDVTQEHQLSEKLVYQASYDDLTGLINRENFTRHLQEQVEQFNITASNTYLCFLDLDHFKLVNDTAGHLVGDVMLSQVASLIKSCLSPNDILGRLGGDEFGLLLVSKNLSEAKSIGESIINAVKEFQFQWNQRQFSVGVSIGMVLINGELTKTELLSKADISCYKAKEMGRGAIYIADLDNNDLYNDQLQMGYIANVAQAIEQEKFYLVKQPIVKTRQTNNVCHYEILIRFIDENNNLVSPALFIPAAEKYGVITLIDHWVVATVCEKYSQCFMPNTKVSINLSGLSLSNQDFTQSIFKLLQNSNVDPTCICFEVTETAAISNLTMALSFMYKMKAIGVKFALDDFGTGASSFGYLKKLPVDYLKVDGSLIKNIATEPVDKAMVESIHVIAKMMNMETIAEFVENDEIREVLAELNIDLVQGYGVGKPVKIET